MIKGGLGGNTCWNFHNKPIVLFTLVKIVLIWILKYNLESKYRPKYFWELAVLTGMSLKKYFRMNFLNSLSAKK